MDTTQGKTARSPRAFRLCMLIGGLWVVLVAVTLTTDMMVVPTPLEPVTRLLYRIGYLLRMPAMVLGSAIMPLEGPGARATGSHSLITSLLATGFWGAVVAVVAVVGAFARRVRAGSDPSAKPTMAISRRSFLVAATGCVAAPGAAAAYSVLYEPQRLRVVRYTVPIRDLPASLSGFRLVHVSDTHYGPFVSLPFLRAVVAQANALGGDLLVLTGDYVHKTPRAIGPGIDVLKGLRARLGVVATLGNHDHWEGANAVRAAFAEIGVPLLDNRRVFVRADGLRDEPDSGESICLGGLGDLWEDATDYAKAVAGAPDAMPRILLAHNPDTAEHVPPRLRVDLMFSGHTHGGQVWLPGLGTPVVPSRYGQKYAGGLCRGPSFPVAVSRGVGMAILPVRFGVRPEIGEITLVRA